MFSSALIFVTIFLTITITREGQGYHFYWNFILAESTLLRLKKSYLEVIENDWYDCTDSKLACTVEELKSSLSTRVCWQEDESIVLDIMSLTVVLLCQWPQEALEKAVAWIRHRMTIVSRIRHSVGHSPNMALLFPCSYTRNQNGIRPMAYRRAVNDSIGRSSTNTSTGEQPPLLKCRLQLGKSRLA
jgi:hypothetical protein